MKMKIFYDEPPVAVDLFNKWAKGKNLTKDVIIHSHVLPSYQPGEVDYLCILVIHPEDPFWDKTETTK